MDQQSDSRHFSSVSHTNAQATLDAGLAALKQKDYGGAIATLESVLQGQTDAITQFKAKMGLVKAYERTGALQGAIALCEDLSSSKNRQASQWGTQTLADLKKRHPQLQRGSLGDESDLAAGLTRRAIARPTAQPPAESESPTQLQSPSTKIQTADLSASSTPPELPVPEPSPPNPPTEPQHLVGQQVGRAQTWGSLGKLDRAKLWAVSAGTVVALVFALRAVFQLLILLFNNTVARLTFPVDLREWSIYADPAPLAILICLLLLGSSTWLLSFLLRFFYGMKPLTLNELEGYSPEAVRLLQRSVNQQRSPQLPLGVLSTSAPVAFTYGVLPKLSRIVVSRGLLEQLSDDEIAAILCGELGHLAHWDVIAMTLVAVMMQLPYLAYRQASMWGDRQRNAVLKAGAIAVSFIGYGLFWLFRFVGLWLSRMRVYFSDRTSVELTGNPNGLTCALLKTTLGISKDIERQRQTSPILESFELLMPVGAKTALNLGSLYPLTATDTLTWGYTNPYRSWLSISNAHPPLGDRLQLLTMYARRWRLPPQLDLPHPVKRRPQSWRAARPFVLQAAPYLGLAVGIGVALLLWAFGAIADYFFWLGFSWMKGDRTILLGCSLAGFSLGVFLRINAFFPDIKRTSLQATPPLKDLINDPNGLPIDSHPVQIQGTLLGRQGIGNLLAQDLMLKSDLGLIKLHHVSKVGPLGNVWMRSPHLQSYINRPVTVTGWFRRGATPWIDVEWVHPQQGAPVRSWHPVWSTLVASVAVLWGCYTIFMGGV